jgi:hypothetical protein
VRLSVHAGRPWKSLRTGRQTRPPGGCGGGVGVGGRVGGKWEEQHRHRHHQQQQGRDPCARMLRWLLPLAACLLAVRLRPWCDSTTIRRGSAPALSRGRPPQDPRSDQRNWTRRRRRGVAGWWGVRDLERLPALEWVFRHLSFLCCQDPHRQLCPVKVRVWTGVWVPMEPWYLVKVRAWGMLWQR